MGVLCLAFGHLFVLAVQRPGETEDAYYTIPFVYSGANGT
jgi:hypothetical protein